MEKGKSIETKDGVYTPQLNEVWHSDEAFRTLERTLYYPDLYTAASPTTQNTNLDK